MPHLRCNNCQAGGRGALAKLLGRRGFDFEQEWAWPTYRILRLLVIVFALVVAYPYIAGSQSNAFKGISLFLGLIANYEKGGAKELVRPSLSAL